MAHDPILVVDADEKSRRVLELGLKKAGYPVHSEESSREALSWLEDNTPGLIISDTDLPRSSGFAFCSQVKENLDLEPVPFIFLTNSSSSEERVRGYELGVEDFLTKPIYIKEITTRVQLLLQRREKELLAVADAEEVRGQLSEVTTIDLLQTIDGNDRSGLVEFSRDRHRGVLYFSDGHVVDAAAGKLRGAEAVYRLCQWSEGSFIMRYLPAIRRPDRVQMPTPDLLLEGLRRLGEWEDEGTKAEGLDRIYEVNYQKLADYLRDLPDEVNAIIRLFDGYRTVNDVLDDSPLASLKTIRIVQRLQSQELVHDVTPQRRAEERELQGGFDVEAAVDLGDWLEMEVAETTKPRNRAPEAETEAEKVRRRREERKRRKLESKRRRDERLSGDHTAVRSSSSTRSSSNASSRRSRRSAAIADTGSAAAVAAAVPAVAAPLLDEPISPENAALKAQLEAVMSQTQELRALTDQLQNQLKAEQSAEQDAQAEIARVAEQQAAEKTRLAQEKADAEAAALQLQIEEARTLALRLSQEHQRLSGELKTRQSSSTETLHRLAAAQDSLSQLNSDHASIREEADRKADAERKAIEETARLVQEQAARKAAEEAERKAAEEAERKAKEEAESARKAAEEAESARKAAEEAEQKAEELRKAEEEAHILAAAKKLVAQREAEQLRKAEEEARLQAEIERVAAEEIERKAAEKAEHKAKEEAESARKAAEEAEAARKVADEADRKAAEEAERKAKEDADRAANKRAKDEAAKAVAREEAERKEKEKAERKKADRIAKEELDAKAAAANALAEAARRRDKSESKRKAKGSRGRKRDLEKAAKEAKNDDLDKAVTREIARVADVPKRDTDNKPEAIEPPRKEKEEAKAASKDDDFFSESGEDSFFSQPAGESVYYDEDAESGSGYGKYIVGAIVLIALVAFVAYQYNADKPDADAGKGTVATKAKTGLKDRKAIARPDAPKKDEAEEKAAPVVAATADDKVPAVAEDIAESRIIIPATQLARLMAGLDPETGEPLVNTDGEPGEGEEGEEGDNKEDAAADAAKDDAAKEDVAKTDEKDDAKDNAAAKTAAVTPNKTDKPNKADKGDKPPTAWEKKKAEREAAAAAAATPDPGLEGMNDAAKRRTVQQSLKKGNRLVAQGKADAGLEELNKAYQLAPGSAQVNLALAKAYRKKQKNGPAITHLERAVKANPKNASAIEQLGTAYMASGKRGKAYDAYKKYLQIRPDGKTSDAIRKILHSQGQKANN